MHYFTTMSQNTATQEFLMDVGIFPTACSAVFTPTALKACRGIDFTHGVLMSGRVGGGKKFVRAISQKP